MKPYEYYNYATPRRKAWWLPLVLILALVLGGAFWRSCAPASDEPLPTGPSLQPIGPVEQAFRTELIGGRLYHVAEGEYGGDYDLQTLTLPETAQPEEFRREAVLDKEAYAAFCAAWGLRPAFPEHDGCFAVVARAQSGAARIGLRLGGVTRSGSSVTLVLRERAEGAAAEAAACVLTVPVPASVSELRTEPLYLPEELPPSGTEALP